MGLVLPPRSGRACRARLHRCRDDPVSASARAVGAATAVRRSPAGSAPMPLLPRPYRTASTPIAVSGTKRWRRCVPTRGSRLGARGIRPPRAGEGGACVGRDVVCTCCRAQRRGVRARAADRGGGARRLGRGRSRPGACGDHPGAPARGGGSARTAAAPQRRDRGSRSGSLRESHRVLLAAAEATEDPSFQLTVLCEAAEAASYAGEFAEQAGSANWRAGFRRPASATASSRTLQAASSPSTAAITAKRARDLAKCSSGRTRSTIR